VTGAPAPDVRKGQALAVAAAFFSLFSIVGFAFYGLPFFYDFFVRELGWTRAQVTSGNAYSKIIVAVLFGFIALNSLKVNLLPDLSYPTLTVRTEYTGAAPAEIETLITEPVEEAVGVVKNLRKLKSVSRTGQSDVVLEFAWGSDMDQASLDVREKLEQIQQTERGGIDKKVSEGRDKAQSGEIPEQLQKTMERMAQEHLEQLDHFVVAHQLQGKTRGLEQQRRVETGDENAAAVAHLEHAHHLAVRLERQRDEELVDPRRGDDGLDVERGADHRDAGDRLALLRGVVVEEPGLDRVVEMDLRDLRAGDDRHHGEHQQDALPIREAGVRPGVYEAFDHEKAGSPYVVIHRPPWEGDRNLLTPCVRVRSRLRVSVRVCVEAGSLTHSRRLRISRRFTSRSSSSRSRRPIAVLAQT